MGELEAAEDAADAAAREARRTIREKRKAELSAAERAGPDREPQHDDHVDTALARPLGEACAGGSAVAGLREEEYGPLRRINGLPAGTRHPERRSRSERRVCAVGGS